MGLAQCHCENSQNTGPEISHLVPLPLRKLAVVFFGYQKPRVRRYCLPKIVKSLQSPVFLEKGLDPVHHVLKESEKNSIEHVRGCKSGVETR